MAAKESIWAIAVKIGDGILKGRVVYSKEASNGKLWKVVWVPLESKQYLVYEGDVLITRFSSFTQAVQYVSSVVEVTQGLKTANELERPVKRFPAMQVQHVRTSVNGKHFMVNKGNYVQQQHFFGGKPVKDRYFLMNDVGRKQPEWHIKEPQDKDLSYFQLVEYRQYASSPFGDADHDGILNIFDKAPLDPRIRKQVPPTVKAGNIKLKDVIGIFSLPRYKTCPGKTPLCSRYCYAEQPEKFRGSVVYSRNKNLAWTLRSDFVSVLSRTINSMELDWFRIHESGDFYSQSYFEKWIEIAKLCPKTKFLAYTKNWMLNVKGLPQNFLLRYSVDLSSSHVRKELPICFVGVNKPKSFFLCKKRCAPGFCMECWYRTDVFIPIHSVSKKNVEDMFFKQFNPSLPKHDRWFKLFNER